MTVRASLRRMGIASVGLLGLTATAHAAATLTATPASIKEGRTFLLDASQSTDTSGTTPLAGIPGITFNFYRYDPAIAGWTLLQASTLATCSTVAPAVAANQAYLYQVNIYYVGNLYSYANTYETVLDNPAPVANAGPAQSTREFRPGVQLSGSATDDEGQLNFNWYQIGGTPVALSNPATREPTFTAPFATQDLTFRLYVTDRDGAVSGPSDVVIHVQPNQAPSNVSAGADQEVGQREKIVLHGAASDPNTDPLSFKWSKVSGPRDVTIENADTLNATFVAPAVTADETYVVRLEATDGAATTSDDVAVLVRAAGSASGAPLLANAKTFPSPFSPAQGQATIRYTLRSASDVNMRISDIFGRQVREISVPAGSPGGTAGDNDVAWDGRNGEGDVVSNGIYIVQVDARDASGARAKVTDKVGVRR